MHASAAVRYSLFNTVTPGQPGTDASYLSLLVPNSDGLAVGAFDICWLRLTLWAAPPFSGQISVSRLVQVAKPKLPADLAAPLSVIQPAGLDFVLTPFGAGEFTVLPSCLE